MFGAGWVAGRVAREIAKANGASEEDARAIGRATSVAVSLIVWDVSTVFDALGS
jgi:hypothetical protein